MGNLTPLIFGRVAQLVEQWTENPRSVGSSPAPPTSLSLFRQCLIYRPLTISRSINNR